MTEENTPERIYVDFTSNEDGCYPVEESATDPEDYGKFFDRTKSTEYVLAALEPAPVTLEAAMELPEIKALASEAERVLGWLKRRNFGGGDADPLTTALAALKGGDA